MCYLQTMEGPKGKKAKSKKAKTGVEVVQDVLKTPPPPMNEDAMYSCGFHPEQKIVNNPLPSYEEMSQACAELARYTQHPKPEAEQNTLPTYEELSLQTQPPVEPLYYLEQGMGGTQVEWTPSQAEEQYQEINLLDYLADENKPLHSVFLLEADSGGRSTCPVFFGSLEQKQLVLSKLCHEIHPKLQQLWGTMSCLCGLVPKLKLSQSQKNPNKVFLSCPRVQEARCKFFQWIHSPPKPVKVLKGSSPSELKKRVNDMVQESLQKRFKEEEQQQQQGGFQFP